MIRLLSVSSLRIFLLLSSSRTVENLCEYLGLKLFPVVLFLHVLADMPIISMLFTPWLYQLQAGHTAYVVQCGVSVVLAN